MRNLISEAGVGIWLTLSRASLIRMHRFGHSRRSPVFKTRSTLLPDIETAPCRRSIGCFRVGQAKLVGAASTNGILIEVVDREPAGAVALIGELFHHPKTDQWAYTTQQPAIRTILEAGLATADAAVKADLEKLISYLVSRGEISFLDLAAKN
jgi:hypothetical protein